MSIHSDDLPNIYVAFLGRRSLHWADVFTDNNFRHCFPFWYDPTIERWIVVEINLFGLNILHLDSAAYDEWLRVLQRAGGKFLVAKRRQSPHFFFRLGLWCVPFTAHTVGSASRAWTPRGLWRDLLREGATQTYNKILEKLHDETSETNSRRPDSQGQTFSRRSSRR